MTSTNKERSVVVIELQGGNDALNTVIPYNNPLYYDFRNNVGIPEGEVLHLDGEVGFNPSLAGVKHIWDQGNIAVINGIGYPNPNRSHFRSRDVWYTAESEKIGAEGWLGAAIRDLDARGRERADRRQFRTRAAPGPWYARACRWRRWRTWRPTA